MLFGWLVLVVALPAGAQGLITDVSLGWGPVDPADLNLFVGTVNGALRFFREDLGAEGEVPPLERVDDVIGLAIGEGLGMGVVVGIEAAVLKAEASTAGSFSVDGRDYPISISLSLRNMRLGVGLSLPLLSRALTVGLSGGVARAVVRYEASFPYPEDRWTFAYVPPVGEVRAAASSFYATAFVRAGIGFPPGIGVYLELRGHWQPEVPLSSPGGELDLNGDGEADRLGFLGFWLAGGITISMAF